MTRTTDTGLSPSNNLSDDLKKRVEYAKGKKADVLVSMHLNSTGLGTAHGAEVYYPNANYNPGVGSEGKNLASKIQKELVGLGQTAELRSETVERIRSTRMDPCRITMR